MNLYFNSLKSYVVLRAMGIWLILFFTLTISQAQVSSDFSSNNESWNVFDAHNGSSSAATYNATGGNPGGYISFTTSSSSVNLFWTAPSIFLGNQSSSYNQRLSFDLKQSSTGTDNAAFDVILTGGGNTINYQLPVKPSATGWSSYSILLNETQWYSSCIGGACQSISQTILKQTLANITKLQIRLKYLSGNTVPYTAQLDNVVLNQLPLVNPPTITSFSPMAATAGTSITLIGTNFNPTATQNVVYFNGRKATVTSATSTQLVVTVPVSAVFGSITVTDLTSGLNGSSVQSFNPLFDNNKDFGGQIIPASMGRGYNVVLPMNASASNGLGRMDKGDFDGDGWIDLISTETSTAKIYTFQNLGTGGSVNISSFGAATALPSLSGIPGGSPYLSEVLVVDVDNDGKLDVAASTANNSTGFLAVYRNTSTVGSISFASPVFFAYNYYSALYMAAGDLDGDGRTDFAFTTGTSPGNVFINQNFSSPGTIDFSFGANLSRALTSGYSDIAIADLTGDGKPEIICPGYNAATISIYQNNSSIGSISMGTAFTIPSIVAYTNQLAVADLDADGKLDMTWSTYGSKYVYFTKNKYAGGEFDATSFGATIQIANTLSNPLGITVGDINSDSKPDVILSGYTDLAILQNVGTGNLGTASFLPTTLFQGSVTNASIFGLAPAVADLDGDNKPEAIFVSSAGSLPAGATGIYIFHNESYPVPSITSISPASATAGSTVSLNGGLLFTGSINPSIRINKLLTTINGNATNNSVSVTTPAASISGKFSITNHGLTSYSTNFNANFSTSRTITTSSFGPSVDFALANVGVYSNLETADFDDDKKVDLVFRDVNGTGIFQNTAAAGQSISGSSLNKQLKAYSGGVNSFCFDFDGDGKIDLNNANYLYQNTSTDGVISFATNVITNASFTGSATADFNKDGKVDVALINASASVLVFENLTSRGLFSNIRSFSSFSQNSVNLNLPSNSSGNGGIVTADFDGDGYDDIAVTTPESNSFSLFKNMAVYGPINSTSFSSGVSIATASQPNGLTASDFDGDGKIDIAVTHYNAPTVNIYLNTSTAGNISFATAKTYTAANFGFAINSQDLDGDGKAEIVTIHNPNPGTPSFTIFQNTSASGAINFASGINYTLSRYPLALTIADLNDDQKPEIIIVGTQGSSSPTNALMVFENKISTVSVSIASQPTNAIVCSGLLANFTTSATGTTNITYQWQFSSDGIAPFTDIANGINYANSNTSSLSINTTANFGAGFYRCKINGDLITTQFTNAAQLTVNSIPAAPSVTDTNLCGAGTATISAAGGTNGQYRWYTVPNAGAAITGAVNSSYLTPLLTASTTYYVAINNGTCESTRTALTVSITPIPSAPITIDVDLCSAGVTTINASGGTNGQYRWYTVAMGGTAIAGEVNSSYTTPVLSIATTYYVAITNGTCESVRTPLNVTISSVITPPTARDVTVCSTGIANITAAGATNGQYRWYTTAAGGAPIAGEVNNIYSTPSLSTTTLYYVAISNGTCESARTTVTVTVTTPPSPPTSADITLCSPAIATLTAAGGSNGQYRWYTAATGGTAIAGEVNNTYTTPNVPATTSYYVSINNGTCESTRTKITITINTVAQSKPIITSVPAAVNNIITICSGGSATLSATAASSYAWSTRETTQQITVSKAGQVSVTVKNSLGCSSPASDALTIVVITCSAEPPSIAPASVVSEVGGKISLAISSLISNLDNTDLTTLKVTKQPASGAKATIDANFALTIDYSGLSFMGQEKLTIEACNFSNNCSTQEITIDIGEVIAYNGISANGDAKNAILLLKYIDVLEDTKHNRVSIYNRWGDTVFEVDDYDNAKHVFTGLTNSGAELPAGTYFYKIEYFSGRKTQTGYLSLKR